MQVEQHIPVRLMTEVLVIGESVSAVSAALAARSAGKKVLLASTGTVVGAELTAALFGSCIAEDGSRSFQEFAAAIASAGGWLDGWLDPAISELTLDSLLHAHGVDVLLYATPLALVPGQPGSASGVIMGGKDGFYTIAAGAIVDASMDGALFRQSGVPFVSPDACRALRTLYFEFAGEGDVDGLQEEIAGFQLHARRCWPDQVCVTMTGTAPGDGRLIPSALELASRQAVHTVARHAIACMPALSDAVLAVTGHQMLPLAAACLRDKQRRHPLYHNVFSAGAWAVGHGWGSINALWQCGEQPGELAANAAMSIRPIDARLPEPVVIETDVVVAGGGVAGVIAALSAGREGVSTVLLESGFFTGGIGTGGGIHIYYHGVCGGWQDEVDVLTAEISADLGNAHHMAGFHPEAKKIALSRLAADAGVELVYGTTAVEAVMDGARVNGVLAVRSGELLFYRAKVIVDATGDADIAASAGADFTLGRQSDSISNVFSLVPGTRQDNRCIGLNFDGGPVDATDVLDLTRARRYGLHHLRRTTPFTRDTRYCYIAPQLGLRQSRQIHCDYQLTFDDQVMEQHFPDTVAYGCCHYDNHKRDLQNESDEEMNWCWGFGFWDRWIRHELPYRSLLPLGIEGMLLACRALGITPAAAMLFRMQRDMQRVGDAAGTAAALAVKMGVTPRNLDVTLLQQALLAHGALRPNQPIVDAAEEGCSEIGWVNHLYDDDTPLSEPFDSNVMCRRLDVPWGSIAGWQLYRNKDVSRLREILHDGGAHARWWASVILAMLGSHDGCGELLGALQDRDEQLPIPPNFPQWHTGWLAHMAPRWQVAIVLLGKARCSHAIEPLLALLQETGLHPNIYVSTIRALAHIGDTQAVPVLSSFLADMPMPMVEEYRSSQVRWLPEPVRHDVSWKLSLVVAEALTALGHADPSLAQAFLDHPHAYVRRYADRVHTQALQAKESVESARPAL